MTYRISALACLLFILFAAPARADSTGGAVAGSLPSAGSFTTTPSTVAPGASVVFALRATPGLQARVDVLRTGAAPIRAKLGRVPASGVLSVSWATKGLAAGRYTARLAITSRGLTAYARTALSIVVPVAAMPAAVTSGVFPVQGQWSFGDGFGVARSGHTHQGQDITADAGTPVVSPVAGTVFWVAYQAAGAGYYVVVTGADGRNYVFMHFQEGSTAVSKGQAVTAGQRLGLVGATGDASGPHLHFEIWLNGWWATKASTPIDPLPQLRAWSGNIKVPGTFMFGAASGARG